MGADMKTVGIIGGTGPESTVAYYRLIIDAYRKSNQDGSYPPIIINSINLTKLLSLVEANELAAISDYLLAEVHKLARAGADFGVLSSNTPHLVFDDIRSKSPIPLISIVEATCQAADLQGLRRLVLLGTRFTMRAHFYPEVFSKRGISICPPADDEQTYIHEKYMREFVMGIFSPEARERLLQIVARMKVDEGVDGVILGGTELPLILTTATVKDVGIPFLDTSQIHVNAIVAELLG
ncbi:MAG: amino acid racemase [Acidobacteriota bacterium]|nr:amino acid racemase [Acidobacteriota bacterium]